jgi:hypothetical protein
LDYRQQINRTEAFKRWFAWALTYGDCDPAIWMGNYINKRYEHNDEQRLWFAWLYGNTYYLPTSWILMNEYPDFELATVDRMTAWNTENYKRLRYQTDTKWNKGHLPDMYASYEKFIGDRTQREVIESYYGDNEKENFNNLWEVLKKELHKFGRYSTWFYMQQLKHTADVKIEPTSLMLNDYSGSRSHRNGFLYAIGEEDKVDSKLTSAEYDRLESIGTGILNEMRVDYPHIKKDLDYFAMETALCSFKKLFRTSRGRYLGYYLDRQAEEIMKVEKDGWHGIEWNVLWEARNETLDLTLSNKCGIIKEKYTSFLDTGKLDKLEMMYKDEVKMNIGLEAFF